MSLMVLLPSSSFFLSGYLTQLIAKKSHNEIQLSYAIKQGNLAALNFSVKQTKLGTTSWLSVMTALAKTQGESAYDLADWYLQQSERIKNLEESDTIKSKAIMWFEQAIRLNSSIPQRKAQYALAQLYFHKNDFLSAQTLTQAIEKNIQLNSASETVDILILQIEAAIALGQTDVVSEKLLAGKDILSKTISGRLLVDDIEKFNVLFVVPKEKKYVNSDRQKYRNASCPSSLQLFATNLKHLRQLEQLQLMFLNERLAPFICLAKPRYLPNIVITCNDSSESAIQCDESKWANVASSVESRHIGLMVEKGGANVHLGMMYLDSDDSIDVFSHEISHLLGFVDEYPN